MNIIIAKLAISLVLTFLAIAILIRRQTLTNWLETRTISGTIAISWILFRLLPFIAVYLIADFEPTSDVNGFWDEGSKASMGQIVYRDFWSPYSPLYAYVLAIGLKFWFSAKMIVVTMALMDLAAVVASLHFYNPLQTRGQLLFNAILYFLLPGSLVLCIIGAQEDVWMWLFVVLAFLLRQKTGKVWHYALVLAIGLLTTKAIFVLILVPLFFLEKEKIGLVATMGLVGIISLAILYPLVGWEFTQPLDEAKTLRAPNILSVINPLFHNKIGVGEKFWNWVGLAIAVGLGTLTALRLKNAGFRTMLSHTWVVMYAAMMIVQQSAYSNYIFLFLIPLIFAVIDWQNKTQIILLLIYNVLCVVHPSVWWRLEMPCYMTPSDPFASQQLTTDYIMQLVIVLLTGYFIWVAFPKKAFVLR